MLAISTIFGFNGDKITFYKHCLDTIFSQYNCLVMYLFGDCKILERMVGCTCFIITEETQVTINRCTSSTGYFSRRR